jgi:UDP-N-acetylmuramoylalanine--D-glutamate ligase
MTLPSSWHTDWSKLSAVVLGLGRSGFSVVDTLVELGVKTVAIGKEADPKLIELTEVIGSEFLQTEDPEVLAKLGKLDFAVVSPGFNPRHPLVQQLSRLSIPILTDIDLAWRLRDKTSRIAQWIVVTGTNGKTTTSELTSAMLSSDGLRSVACGNIGFPILDAIRDPDGFDFLVVELSSFQLHYLGAIEPLASAFLNFAEDHYDWHDGEANYFAAKSKIYTGTTTAIVFNEQDKRTFEAAQAADVKEGCRGVSFSLFSPQRSSVGFVEDVLVDRAFLDNRANEALEIATLDEIKNIAEPSPQLLANIAAATALARAAGVSTGAIRKAITTFKLAPHRNQLIAEIDGIRFVNDSKATNPHAADSSLRGYESIVWIVGGLLKGTSPRQLIEAHSPKLRGVVIIGKDTEELERLFSEGLAGLPVRVISGERVMQQAVSAARELAMPGDVVLLAPAAASMDQFLDYADRGNQFIAAVEELK